MKATTEKVNREFLELRDLVLGNPGVRHEEALLRFLGNVIAAYHDDPTFKQTRDIFSVMYLAIAPESLRDKFCALIPGSQGWN